MLSRRELLLRGSALVGASALSGLPDWSKRAVALPQSRLPDPASSGIDHVIVVTMENRSFDHFLGWLPGADGRQDGLVFDDAAGVSHETHHLTEFQGCGFSDPDHSWEGGRVEYDNGACDGWLRAGANDEFAIGYYTASDLAFYAKEFKTPDGSSRSTWEAQRKERIAAPKSIHVEVRDAKVKVADDKHASVSFKQTYRASHLNVASSKTLNWVKADGQWLIAEERSGK